MIKKFLFFLTIILGSLSLALLSGCADDADDEFEEAGDNIEDAAEDIGEDVEDAAEELD